MRPGYSVIEATNWYAYVSNNPMKYVDPTGEDDQYYELDGSFIRTVEAETDNTYVEYTEVNEQNEAELIQELVGTTKDFDAMVAAVYAESSGDSTESFAIASVIENRLDITDKEVIDILENTGIYDYKSTEYNSVHGSRSNDDSKLNTVRAATINALTDGKDFSKGAYFWEGLTFIDSSSSAYNKENWFVRKGWGTTAGTDGSINYLETTRHGGTVFLRNNPALHGKRRYP